MAKHPSPAEPPDDLYRERTREEVLAAAEPLYRLYDAVAGRCGAEPQPLVQLVHALRAARDRQITGR